MRLIDIEDALQASLNANGFTACAKPLPASFQTPHVTVDALNVQPANEAQAIYIVDFDVRADGYAEAAEVQLAVVSWLRGLVGTDVGGVPLYALDDWNVQRAQPDAAHPTVILGTVSANLRMRLAD